jgi:hypothetical protein
VRKLDHVPDREARRTPTVRTIVAVVSLPDLFAHDLLVCNVFEIDLPDEASYDAVLRFVRPTEAGVEIRPECVCCHEVLSCVLTYK